MERILQYDSNLFIYLNGLGSETWDPFWLAVTKIGYWIPFYVFLLWLVQRKLGWKQTLWVLLCVAVLITVTDQVVNLVKSHFQRPRPCNDEGICYLIRSVKTSSSFSFFSGHAANSMANATFVFLLLRRQYRLMGLLFFWPLVFAYSRIYLGLHYPGDIAVGYLFGALMGTLFFRIYLWSKSRVFAS